METRHCREIFFGLGDCNSTLVWTIFTGYLTIGSAKTKGARFAVFAAMFVTSTALTIGGFTQIAAIAHFGGFVGLIAAVFACYSPAAVVIDAISKRPVFPVCPIR